MNLLELTSDDVFRLRTFRINNVPPYAILSHTWGTDEEEVTYQDIIDGTGRDKAGYEKLWFCAQQAKSQSLRYFWVDTCCINKSNSVELQRAINSMFRWYQNSSRCYVYLSDVLLYTEDGHLQHLEWESAFCNSRWFTRGWTLQELIAPKKVEFYSRDRIRLGDKSTLERQIIMTTGIAKEALQGQSLSQISIEERLSWTRKRQTTEEEDGAYCLLGIFDVFLPLIYGEGQSNAMRRLHKAIRESSSDSQLPFENSPRSASSGVESPRPEDWYARMVSQQRKESDASTLGAVVQTLKGHSDWVDGVAFSPDSTVLASAAGDKTVKLWDVRSWAVLHTLEGHSDGVFSVDFSPDGKLLASASRDTTVMLWDVPSRTALHTFEGHSDGVFSIEFSPDGRILASASRDSTIKLWDVRLLSLLHTFEGHSDGVFSAHFSPDGKKLASGSSDKTVRVWDIRSRKVIHTLKGHSNSVVGVTFSPNGKLIASASRDMTARVWDVRSHTVLHTITGYTRSVLSVAFSPDSMLLALASSDETIRLWDVRSQATLEIMKDHSEPVVSLAFSRDGKLLASGSGDTTVRLWDARWKTAE